MISLQVWPAHSGSVKNLVILPQFEGTAGTGSEPTSVLLTSSSELGVSCASESELLVWVVRVKAGCQSQLLALAR